ncbi:hypothetical protein [Actinoplanes regularis]|nr:hypothetical protein [Actinoplanes regularis]
MDQSASYSAAQQAANNDATRAETGQLTQAEGYTPPTHGRPDDEDNLRSWVSQAYAEIPAMFAAFALPSPDTCRPALEALYGTAATVQVDLQMVARDNSVTAPNAVRPLADTAQVGEVVDLIRSHMSQWRGTAATAFKGYLKTSESAAALHRELALSLALGLETQLEINRRINTDIWTIGQQTLKALDGLDSWCPGGNASKVTALITIGGAIAAVVYAGVAVEAGAAASALAGAVGVEGWQSLGTILGNTGPFQEKKVGIGGMTVPPIITGMQNAMTELSKTADALQQQLTEGLSKYTLTVHTNSNWDRLLISPPEQFTRYTHANAQTLRTPDGLYVA